LQDRQREGCGLAGAGLGNADQVLFGKEQWDCASLNRRGIDVVLVIQGAPKWLGQTEI
jgi:hypothetical protein